MCGLPGGLRDVVSRLDPARRLAHVMSPSRLTLAVRYRFVPISFVYLLSIKFPEHEMWNDTPYMAPHTTAFH